MRVERLDGANRADGQRWDAFVQACPGASFFHRAGWLRVIERSFGHRTHFLQALGDDGVVLGVLPLSEIKSRLFGHSLSGLPFASYGGIAAARADAHAALQAHAVALARSLGVGHLELRNVERQQHDWPTQDLYVAFKLDIPPVLDEKMLAIPQKRRNMVRKALKLGLRAVPDDSVDNFFPVFATNARDHGTPTLPKRYFEQLQAEFGSDCRILSIYTAAGLCISSILCFFHKGEVLAYYAGERLQARGTAANDLKYWEVMKWAQSRGCTRFDLGRSKKGSGSFDFKRLWGFEPVQLHYQYRLFNRDTIPQNNPNNPRYRMLIQAWQKLPLPVANTLGPWLVRSLG
jgi:FemAB-related protein (PEP-CTERM system-associated)